MSDEDDKINGTAAVFYEVEQFFKEWDKELKFAVAVDGSKMSDKTMEVTANLARSRCGSKDPELHILHISDKTKASLPRMLAPDYLEKHYESAAIPMHVRPAWYNKDKDGASTTDAVMQLTNELKVDFIGLGAYGRKGEKLEMLGTVAGNSLRFSDSSIVVVKPSSDKLERSGRTFVLATDDSPACQAAFAVVMRLVEPKDTVHVVYVSAVVAYTSVLRWYGEVMEERGIQGSQEFVSVDSGTAVATGILEFCDKKDTDFLVLGISGYSKAKLGSISEECVTYSRCTCIVVKDPREVSTQRSGGKREL